MYIPIDLLEKNEASNAVADIASRKAEIKAKSAAELDGPQRFMQRRAMLSDVAPESLDLAFERYIGDNDLLPINYLQIGTLRSLAVGRLRYFDVRVNRNAMATGFLISPDLVLTNHHVFSDEKSFRDPLIDFDYAYGVDGRELDKITFGLDPGKFFYANEALDCALIGISSLDESKAHSISERGCLVLNPATGKIGVGDYATIIQYPDGNYQEIALRKNEILEINPTALIYVSDTSPGSSGSPVFNDQWQVIALHSAGVAKKEGGNYVDKDGRPIPVINGHIDASQIVWVSNTGIRVSSLINDWLGQPALRASKYLQFLNDPNYSDDKNETATLPSIVRNESESLQTLKPDPMKTIDIPAGAGRPGLTINININVGDTGLSAAEPGPAAPSAPASVLSARTAAESFEAKIADEKNKDYSSFSGFDDRFMGMQTPLPTLDKQLSRQVATLTNNPKLSVLKYEHYSTIMHSIRRMPIVSAINVEGDPSVRLDKTKRNDVWLRDNRIDFAVQLTDDYYKASGFDKGHMSRREDADWGDSAADAEAAANLTCMYTNACPQVPTINRSSSRGLWGQLEKIILEKGVEAESGKASRICVYNGPIFVGTDPTYKGVQVPMRFFKIVVWRNGAGDMKATAFVLSQEDLVGGIQFEELQFDKEFIEHQCSIAFIEDLTKLTFAGINQFDTSPQKGDKKAVATVDRAAVEAHVAGNAKAKKKP